MKNRYLKNLIIFIFIFFTKSIVFAQQPIRTVSNFTAFTHDKAVSGALRTALEMAAGLYITSKSIIQNDELVKIKCNHIFHCHCIKSWLCNESNKCPVCRIEVGKGIALT